MGLIPDETLHEIRDRTDIVALVSRHITLKKAGRNFKGLCPFHNEKTPSFSVNVDRQVFHCFGCGVGGNAFDFIMKHDNLTFPEAVRILARECGVEIPESGGSGNSGLSERLYTANEIAQAFYRDTLKGPAGAPARRYLADRGIDAEIAERYELGFAQDRWDGVVHALDAKKISREIGERAGLLVERPSGGHYDRLRGRIIFPIRDVRDRIVGFGGRAIGADQEPKYLNSPETPIYSKRKAFFGFPGALAPIRRAERAVIAEGYFDSLALCRAGVEETLATCGTSLTADHARDLRKRVREVILIFDGDEAGQRAMERSLDVLLPEGLRVRAAVLPAGDDPDTLLRREGPDALRAIIDEAAPALDAVIRRAVSQGCTSAWEKSDAVASVAPILVLLPDAVERAERVRQLALATGTEVKAVAAAVRRAAGQSDSDEDELAPVARKRELDERFYEGLARILIAHPRCASLVDAARLSAAVSEGPWRALISDLAAAGNRGGTVEVAELANQMEGEARTLLLTVALGEEHSLDESSAEGAFHDIIAKLEERQRSQARRAATRQYSEDPSRDSKEWLAAKQRQLEERRAAHRRARSQPNP